MCFFSAFAHAYTYAYEALEAQRDTLWALELEIFMVMNQYGHAGNFCSGLLQDQNVLLTAKSSSVSVTVFFKPLILI